MHKLSSMILAALAAVLFALPAAAFEAPNAAEVVPKVKKSVIRIQGIAVGQEMASGGYGGGSGVVFELDYDAGTAYALTNHHVSGDSVVSGVRFWDGAEYRAELVGTEPGIDVSLLRIYGIPDERDLPFAEKTIIAAPLGDSDLVQIGDYAIAMGAPGAMEGFRSDRSSPYEDFLLQQTTTDGVVTGRDSVLDFPMGIWQQNRNGLGQQYGTNFDYAFRVTVPINGGNSGGPLFNRKGEVIGLNFYGGSWSMGQNYNHSIPINLAKDFAYQVINTGKFEKPWIGLDVVMPPYIRTTEQFAEFADRRGPGPIEVFDVRRDSSAARAGFRKGDVIASVDGRRFEKPEELRLYVFDQKIGTQMSFEVLRNGKRLRDPIVVEVQPKRLYDAEFSI